MLVSPDALFTRYCGVPRAHVNVCAGVTWALPFPDPETVLRPLFAADAITPTATTNMSLLDAPEIETSMRHASAIVDSRVRERAWGVIDRRVTALAAAIPVVWPPVPLVRSADVAGVANGWGGFWDLTFTSLRPPRR